MSIFDKKINKAKKFENATKGKSKKEIRAAEMVLLKPENIPDYSGELPLHKSELGSRTALIVFSSTKQQKLIGELLSIRTNVQGVTYITDISLLEHVAQAVKDGIYTVSDGMIVLPEAPEHTKVDETKAKNPLKRGRKPKDNKIEEASEEELKMSTNDALWSAYHKGCPWKHNKFLCLMLDRRGDNKPCAMDTCAPFHWSS